MNIEQNKELKARSRELRKSMTKEERHLWYDFLSMLPVRFRRQQIIGNYIVDFYCDEEKLVVELDGSQHYEEHGKAYDHVRDQYLQEQGLTVLRYSNADIGKRFESVCESILQHISEKNQPK